MPWLRPCLPGACGPAPAPATRSAATTEQPTSKLAPPRRDRPSPTLPAVPAPFPSTVASAPRDCHTPWPEFRIPYPLPPRDRLRSVLLGGPHPTPPLDARVHAVDFACLTSPLPPISSPPSLVLNPGPHTHSRPRNQGGVDNAGAEVEAGLGVEALRLQDGHMEGWWLGGA
jgi:hypothetical protein